jgi:histidinol-phosphate aminotransferase
MSRFWNPAIEELSPYVPGEQPKQRGLIKLNTNEMPVGPSPRVLAALREMSDESLRLYPDPESSELREVFAAQAGLSPRQVFVGNGSDEVLAHTFKALFQPSAALLFPDITYSFYPVYCRFFGLESELIALDENFRVILDDYRRPNGGIIFPNPNAPTGIYTPLEDIEALLRENRDTVVVVDEAYIDFGGQSAVSLIAGFPNLLVIQTLSKSRALAGLRVGVAFGQEALIEGLKRVKNSFNSYPLGRLAEMGAVAALEDEEWFRNNCDSVIRSREKLCGQLQGQGFEVLPSAANFLFVRHPRHAAEKLYQALRERGILVRHFRQARIENFLRITIGRADQCEALVAALEELLRQPGKR